MKKLLIILLSQCVWACSFPAARHSAFLKGGTSFSVESSMALPLKTEKRNLREGEDPSQIFQQHLQFNIGRSWKFDSGRAFELRLKQPAYFTYSQIDAYFQLLHSPSDAAGLGLEVGQFSSVYGIYSKRFSKDGLVSFTMRGAYILGCPPGYFYPTNCIPEGGISRFVMNPQVYIGIENIDISRWSFVMAREQKQSLGFFVSYFYIPNKGVEFKTLEPHILCGVSDSSNCNTAYDRFTNHLLMMGLSAGF